MCMNVPIHWKRPWLILGLRAEEKRHRAWDGWLASPTQWTWTWANSAEMVRDRQACCVTVHRVAKNQTRLGDRTTMYECIHSILATFRLKKGVRPSLKRGSCCSWWLSEIRTLSSVIPPPGQKNKCLKIKDTVSDYKIYSLMLFCRPTLFFHFHGQLSKVDGTQPLRPLQLFI